MVIKYLEINQNEHCFFSSRRIILDVSAGGWSHLDLIVNSSILVDRFRHLKPVMKSTLFKALGDMDFTILAQDSGSYSEKRYIKITFNYRKTRKC